MPSGRGRNQTWKCAPPSPQRYRCTRADVAERQDRALDRAPRRTPNSALQARPAGRANESTCTRLASQTAPGRLPPTGGCSVQFSSDQTAEVVLPAADAAGRPAFLAAPRRLRDLALAGVARDERLAVGQGHGAHLSSFSWRVGDSVQDEPDDPRPRPLRRPAVPARAGGRTVHATALNARSAVSAGILVARAERPVLRALAEEMDERVEVSGGPAGRRLVERLVRREHQRQVAVEQLAQRLEPALRTGRGPMPRTVRTGYIVDAEVVGELAEERLDERLPAEPLAPERRARPARGLGDALERQAVPAVLAQHLDRGVRERARPAGSPLLPSCNAIVA